MKHDRVRLQHMLEAAYDIIEMTSQGERDKKTELAVTRLIEIIGEAARNVSPSLKERYPGIPWANIIGMRNLLIHEYFRVSGDILWDTVTHKVPVLRDWLEGIIEQIEGKQS